ncbi:MAG: type II toxin-antitoxin system prevent-host-death family antitoxin [Patescibacteria group bacterium]
MLQVNTHQAKSQLSRLIDLALAGEKIVIARAGKPKIDLVPHKAPLKPRVAGKFKGKIWMSDDFDDESDEINEMFYGGAIEP